MRGNAFYKLIPLRVGQYRFRSQISGNFAEIDAAQPFIREIRNNNVSATSASPKLLSIDSSGIFHWSSANSGLAEEYSRPIGYALDGVPVSGDLAKVVSFGIVSVGGTEGQPAAFQAGESWPGPGELLYLTRNSAPFTDRGTFSTTVPPAGNNRRVPLGYTLDFPYIFFNMSSTFDPDADTHQALV